MTHGSGFSCPERFSVPERYRGDIPVVRAQIPVLLENEMCFVFLLKIYIRMYCSLLICMCERVYVYHVHLGAHRPEEGDNSRELVLAGSCKLSGAGAGN